MADIDKSVLVGLVHLEILVNDPQAAADYLKDVVGAVQVEAEFSKKIEERFDCEDIHMQAGGVVFQLIKPKEKCRPSLSNWWHKDRLDKWGQHIHNITFMVRDPDALAAKIVERGGKKLGTEKAFAPDLVTESNVYMYDASEQCGVIFEFVQAPPGL